VAPGQEIRWLLKRKFCNNTTQSELPWDPLLIGLAAPQTQAQIGVALVGIGTLTDVSTNASSPTYGSSLGAGFGAIADIQFSRRSRFSLEPGFTYLHRSFATNYSMSQSGKVTLTYLELPVLVRAQIRSRFSIAAGPYLAQGLGTVDSTVLGDIPYSSAGIRSLDFGYEAGLRYLVFERRSFSGLVEVRYFSSLLDIAEQAGTNFQFKGVETLIGIHFGR
jgi:hypothetical protein